MFKVYTVIESSEVKATKVCNKRLIDKFAKGTYVFINLNSMIKLQIIYVTPFLNKIN